MGQRRHILEWTNIAEAVSLEVWQMYRARLKDVAECIGAGIAPFRRIGHRADARAVQHDQQHSIERITRHEWIRTFSIFHLKFFIFHFARLRAVFRDAVKIWHNSELSPLIPLINSRLSSWLRSIIFNH